MEVLMSWVTFNEGEKLFNLGIYKSISLKVNDEDSHIIAKTIYDETETIIHSGSADACRLLFNEIKKALKPVRVRDEYTGLLLFSSD